MPGKAVRLCACHRIPKLDVAHGIPGDNRAVTSVSSVKLQVNART